MQRRPLAALACVLAWGCTSSAATATPADTPVVLVAATDAGVVQLDPVSGAQLRLLVPGGLTPAVSHDGRRLVFGLRDGTAQHLWVSDVDGTNRVQVTSGNATDTTPEWSPDGRTLALCRATGSWASRLVRIAVVGSNGAGGHAVPGTEGGCSPSWSPDSTLIAYASPDGVRATDPDGRSNELITAAGGNPAWSPDGRTLAVTDVGGGDSDLTLVDIRSGQRTKITPFEGYHVTWQEPSWAPDGGSLYTSTDTETFPDENNTTHLGTQVEHRDRDGQVSFTQVGARSPGAGGGPAPIPDTTPPAPVAATATPRISGIDVASSAQAEPDAAGIVVRYAAGDAAPESPQDGMAGGRSVTGHVALRHLAADTTYAISVFPVDWSGNVGERTITAARTPHEVGTTLGVTAAPEFVTYGQSITVRGRLVREDTGRPVEGAAIELSGHLRGQPDKVLATLTTDTDGVVASRRLPSGETTYTLRYAGSDPLVAASDDVVTHVRVAVATQLSATVVWRTARASVTVRLRPALTRNKVYIEQRINGKLRYRTTALTDRGVATVALDTRIRGSYTVTASTNGDGLRTYGVSAPRSLTVR